MLRSEAVERINLYVRKKYLKDSVCRIGECGIIQIDEANNNKKPEEMQCSDKLVRLDRIAQRVEYFRLQINERNKTIDTSRDFKQVKKEINSHYKRIVALNTKKQELEQEKIKLEEEYVMTSKSVKFLRRELKNFSSIRFKFAIGMIDRENKFLARKTIKQRLRRNVYVRMYDVELMYGRRQRTLLIIYVIGDDALKMVKQIIEIFNGQIYSCEIDQDKIRCRKSVDDTDKYLCSVKLKNDGNNKSTLLNNGSSNNSGDNNRAYLNNGSNNNGSNKHIHSVKKYVRQIERRFSAVKKQTRHLDKRLNKYLEKIGQEYLTWKYHVNKQRLIYEIMNKFVRSESKESFLGKGWILKDKVDQLVALRETGSGNNFTFEVTKTEENPPSYFRTNAVTEAFQGLTNVFGVPKYGEINPAIFMLFTFPFMFGAMFGDILHGLLLGMAAVLMIVFFERLNHRCGVLQIVLEGRYVVLTCAVAAVWFGFLYGDFGSLPVTLFRSQFETGRTYPFGIDPAWHHAVNKTVFINSVKMKLSIILGFVHMTLGAVIAVTNAIYFRDKVALFCTAIPQLIVFVLFLGYLVFLCIYKWLVTATRPSLVNTLIAMYTSPFRLVDQMYTGQLYVQLFIVAVILFCIPWMLLSRPVYMILRRRAPPGQLLDMWIGSAIHVVEFGLGLISNTSSYLRLWAVSLAHVQLTSVLHQFTIGSASRLLSFLLFPVYLIFTSLLLIGLEGLSACLHALRLNWIEFFSKFYAGGAIAFEPFSFKLKDDDIYDD